MPPDANDTTAPTPAPLPNVTPLPVVPEKSRGGDRGGSKKQRATQAQLEKRLDQVEEWLAYYSRAWVLREAKKRWDVERSTVDDYLAKVKERWAAASAAGRGEARARQIRRLERIARDSMRGTRKNPFAALQAEQLLSQLEGTKYQPGDDLPQDEGAEIVCDIDLPDEDLAEPPALKAVR